MKCLKSLLLILVLTTPAYTQTNSDGAAAEEAIKIAQAEVQANPNSSEAYFKLGEAYLAHYYSVADKAAKAFYGAIRHDPYKAEAYYKLALALDRTHRHRFEQRHPKEEMRALRKAIELKPDYAEAYVQLARTYMANPTLPKLDLEKTYVPAAELLTKAIEIRPELVEAYEELSQVYLVLKQDGKAGEARKKAEELKKDQK